MMKYTFRFKILLIMITSILVPLIFLSVYVTDNSKVYYEELIDPVILENVEKDIRQIEQFFVNSQNELQIYGNIIAVSSNKNYINETLERFVRNNEIFENSFYTSELGENFINGNRTTGFDGRERDWYKTVKNSKSFQISDPYEDIISKKQVITLSVPIVDENRFLGVLGVDVLLDDIIKQMANNSRLIDATYIIKDTSGNIKYFNDTRFTEESVEEFIRNENDKYKFHYYYLGDIKMQLYIGYSEDSFSKEVVKIGYDMSILFIFVGLITIVFAFSGAKNLSEPLRNFKDKIRMMNEPDQYDALPSDTGYWDEEFYTLFTKFNKLSQRIRLDKVRLSKRVKSLQEKNDELMSKNIDLEEIYKNLKLIDKKVRKSKIEYESILENIKGMIWVLDSEGRIIYVNKLLEAYIGIDAENLMKKPLDKILDNDYSDKFSLFDIIKDRDYKKIELNLINHSRKKMLVDANTSRVLDDSGNLLYIYGICRGLNEIKELHYNYNVKIQEQNLIMDLTETASMNVSMNQVTKAIFEKINSIFGWSVGTIRFLNENNEFELIARTDVGTDYIVSQSLDYENSCLTYVVEKNEILYINSTEELPIKEEIYCQIIEDGYSLIFIPVGNNDIGRGVISLTIDRLSMIEKEEMLRSFTNTILIVVERALIYEKLKKDYIRMIKVLAEAGDDKDSSSVGHSNRVATYSKKIAEHLYLDDEEIIDLEICGLLHDIGKIGISDEFLSKKSQLAAKGIEKVKEHPSIGRKMLEDIGLSEQILDGIEMHHMNFDLSGYPVVEGVEYLPLFPRIIQVADEFDNIKVKESFLSNFEIWDKMNLDVGVKFCPQIMKVLKDIVTLGSI